MGWWNIEDVTDWPTRAHAHVGKRAKVWVKSPLGKTFMRKAPQNRAPSEAPIEVVAFEVVRRLGLPVPTTCAAEWNESGELVRGLLSENFVPKGSEKHLGVTFLSRDEEYDRDNYEMHSLSRIRACLSMHTQEREQPPADLLVPFARMLYSDYLLGLGDRHQENWSILQDASGKYTLAPLYDLDSCLGARLDDNHKLLDDPQPQAVREFAEKCPSAFGNDEQMLRMSVVLDTCKTWPEWPGVCRDYQDRLCDLDFTEIVEEVPSAWLSDCRRRLAIDLLDWRRECLLNT